MLYYFSNIPLIGYTNNDVISIIKTTDILICNRKSVMITLASIL